MKTNTAVTRDLRDRNKSVVSKTVFAWFCVLTTLVSSMMVVFAADEVSDIFAKITSTIQTFLTNLNSISTIVCALVVVIALIWRMISSNPRSVETATSWAKRAAISFAIINSLTFIINWFTTTFDGAYNGG